MKNPSDEQKRLDAYVKFLAFIAVTCLVIAVVSSFTKPYDNSDAPNGDRSGFTIMTDHLTGCQYLRYNSYSLTPRMDQYGKQICIKK